MFKLDVLYECFDGSLAVVPSSHVVEQLHNIIKMTSDLSTCPVGILTSEQRDTWTECRERLLIGNIVEVPCQSLITILRSCCSFFDNNSISAKNRLKLSLFFFI